MHTKEFHAREIATHSRMRKALCVLLCACAAPLALAVTPGTPAADKAARVDKVVKEEGAVGSVPAFAATALDGTRIDFSKAPRRGRWQVVNFWATWCAPCIQEIPELARFDNARADVDVVGLAFEDSDVADIRKFLKEHPAGYPIVHVDPYAPLIGFAVPRGLPTTYLIAPDGRIAERMIGPVDGKVLMRAIGRHAATDANAVPRKSRVGAAK
ncbi:MAG: TlpA disulfide reductase family protein [Lysobacterales bacterium]